jgi:hypothetical protein
MSDNPSSNPGPHPEHARLASRIGAWNIECTYFLAGDQSPLRAKGREVIRMLGPFWSISDFRSELMGAPFVGQATVGFDPERGLWVAHWVDSTSPFLLSLEGPSSEDDRVIQLEGDARNVNAAVTAHYRSREERLAQDARRFEMWMTLPDAEETKIMEYDYRRAE